MLSPVSAKPLHCPPNFPATPRGSSMLVAYSWPALQSLSVSLLGFGYRGVVKQLKCRMFTGCSVPSHVRTRISQCIKLRRDTPALELVERNPGVFIRFCSSRGIPEKNNSHRETKFPWESDATGPSGSKKLSCTDEHVRGGGPERRTKSPGRRNNGRETSRDGLVSGWGINYCSPIS